MSYFLLLKMYFSELFSAVFWYIHLKFCIWICLDVFQINIKFCCALPTFTWLLPFAKIWFSGLFSCIFWNIDLKFGIWICLDVIQIKFHLHHKWPTLHGLLLPSFCIMTRNLVNEFYSRDKKIKLHFCFLFYLFLPEFCLFEVSWGR